MANNEQCEQFESLKQFVFIKSANKVNNANTFSVDPAQDDSLTCSMISIHINH